MSDPVVVSVELAAPPARAWRALTQELGAWWGEHVTLELRLGGRLVERWTDAGGRPVRTTGEVVRLSPPTALELAWADEGWPAPTRVHLELEALPTGTRLTLVHAGWAALAAGGRDALVRAHAAGWSRHLASLAHHLGGPGGLVRPQRQEDRASVRAVLDALGWEPGYVAGQLDALDADARPGGHGAVFVAERDGAARGYLSLRVHAWNRLAQLHGLAVAPVERGRGVARALVAAGERFARERGARGVRVDTPVTNRAARALYASLGYEEDGVMRRYYADDLDGIAFVRFFAPAP